MVLAAARALRADRVHGAMELALRAIESAADLLSAHPERDVQAVARALATARPSMAAIGNAVVLTLAPVVADHAARALLPERVERLRLEWIADGERLTQVTRLHIPKDILTYSHVLFHTQRAPHHERPSPQRDYSRGAAD